MATIQEIIERVDERKPNAFSQKAKMAWIAELDGKIAVDVMLMNINDVRQFNYAYPDNLSSEPLIEFPHDSIYDLWLGAKIDFENGEYTKYQNSMEQYNAHYSNFVHWFASTYEPAQGYDCSANNNPPYYITAYALAVKSGFNGTLNEWLESLQGDKVELRYLDDKIKWRWIPNTGANDGVSDTENEGIENDFQWHDLINVATIRGEIINHTLQTAAGAAESAKASEENAKRYAESIKPPVYLVTFSDTNDANSKWCNQEYSSIMTAHLAGLSVKCQYENYTLPLVQIGNAECIFGATVGTSYRCIVVHSDRIAIVSTRSTVPVYLVTINDANKAVESYADRLAAYQSGYVVQCDYLGTRLPLKAIVETDFMFSGTIDGHSYHVVVRSNGSTVIKERSLASTTKVSLTEQSDGSYLSNLSAGGIMAAYKAANTVHCYHNQVLLPLIHSAATSAVFSGIYDGQIHTVTVDSNKVATVTATPISSGGGSVDLTGYATEEYVNKAIEDIELTPGPAGPQGEVGPQGPQGPQGEQGDDYQLTEADKKEIAAMAGPPEWQKIDVQLEENVYYITISIPNAKEVYIFGEMYGNDAEGTLGDIGKAGGYDLFINGQRHYGGITGQVGVCFPIYEVWEISSVGTRLAISYCGATDGHMGQSKTSTDVLPYAFEPIHTLQLYSFSEYYFDKRSRIEVWYR